MVEAQITTGSDIKDKTTTSQSTPTCQAQTAAGPRTDAGKKRSRRNALKHGIFSKRLILDGELRADLEKLHRDLREYYQPQGAAEKILVEKLAIDLLRESRAIEAEHAIIARSPAFGAVVTRPNSDLLITAMKRLCQLSENITTPGFDFAEDLRTLNDIYSTYGAYSDQGFCASFSGLMKRGLGCNPPDGEKKSEEDATKLAGKLIENEFGRLYELSQRVESNEVVSASPESLLPFQRELDLTIRYGSHLSREIERRINLLERLQRTRRGYPPPPTIKVDLG